MMEIFDAQMEAVWGHMMFVMEGVIVWIVLMSSIVVSDIILLI